MFACNKVGGYSPSILACLLGCIELYAKALDRSCKLQGIDIRPITARDNESLALVLRYIRFEYNAVGADLTIKDDVDDMYGAFKGKRSSYFVACKGEQLLGGAGIAPLRGGSRNVSELQKMCLLPEGRELGLGRKLLGRCLDEARRLLYKHCYLETLKRMIQARHLYTKFGFRELDEPMGNTGHYWCDSWAIKDL